MKREREKKKAHLNFAVILFSQSILSDRYFDRRNAARRTAAHAPWPNRRESKNFPLKCGRKHTVIGILRWFHMYFYAILFTRDVRRVFFHFAGHRHREILVQQQLLNRDKQTLKIPASRKSNFRVTSPKKKN